MSHDWNICPVCRAHYFEPEGHSCDVAVVIRTEEIERLRARLAEAERLLREVQVACEDFDGAWVTLDKIDAFLADREPE